MTASMTDFRGFVDLGYTDPPRHAAAVTPSDSADLAHVARAIWVGTGGDLEVTMLGGDRVTIPGIPSGTLLPLIVSKVWADATDADGLVAFW